MPPNLYDRDSTLYSAWIDTKSANTITTVADPLYGDRPNCVGGTRAPRPMRFLRSFPLKMASQSLEYPFGTLPGCDMPKLWTLDRFKRKVPWWSLGKRHFGTTQFSGLFSEIGLSNDWILMYQHRSSETLPSEYRILLTTLIWIAFLDFTRHIIQQITWFERF
jgi:hypothetical protein